MTRTASLLVAVPLLVAGPSAEGRVGTGLRSSALVQQQEAPSLAEQGRLLDPIMTAAERERWQQLGSDAARETFVQELWERRDPTPGTARNEVREAFEQRLRRANRMFGGGDVPGWATDRGRVLLVYGLPEELEARSPDGSPAPEIVWTYRPEVLAEPVRFVRRGPAYVADPLPTLGNDAFLASTADEVRLMLAAAFGGAVDEEEPAAAGPALGVTDEAADQPVTPAATVAPEVRIWMQQVLGGVQRDDLALRSALRTFPAQQGTYTVLAFHVGAEGLTFVDPLMVPEETVPDAEEVDVGAEAAETGAANEEVEIVEAGAGEPEQEPPAPEAEADTMPEGPVAEIKVFGAFLQGEPGRETTVHQFVVPVTLAEEEIDDAESPLLSLGVTLVPGTYRLAWGVMDVASERAVTRDSSVEIPDFATAGLSITDPLVARPPHAEAVEEMSTQSVYRGVRLGNVLIADDLDRTFGRDEIIEIVTVVTGWQPDPNQPGRPRLEVLYRVLEGEEDVSIARLQPQSLDFHVLGQQIPLSQIDRLEEGKDYRILIQVTDSVSGELALKQVPISIRGGESDAASEGEPEG